MARQFNHPSWSVGAGLLLALVSARVVHAQVNTPAAREARAQLVAVERTFSSASDWAVWARRLGLADVRYELRAGDRAEPASLQWAIGLLHGGSTAQFRDPAFQRLATLLEKRAAEIAAIPSDEWPAQCYRQAERYAPVGPQVVQAARQTLVDRLDDLARRLPSLADPKDPWRTFLSWNATRGLVYTDMRDEAILDRLEARWQGAPLVWDTPELVDASLAVQSYIRLYRGYLANESKEAHAAAWTELGKLLESDTSAGGGNAARIAALVNGRERLGQGSALTASIRREFSRPNVILQARVPWVQEQLSERINDRYNVDDVYAGARSVGTGTLTATMRCQLLASSAVGQAILQLDGTSNARTSGSSEGVSVSSRATTKIHGEKSFTLDRTGLSTRPATATADTSIVYDSIDAPGLRRRRNESIRQTHARRPRAEADADAATRREIVARMDAEGNDLVAKFNRSYTALRDRQFETHRRAPEVRVRTGGDVVRWECRLESPALFAAPGTPPTFEPTADVTLSIAASAMEEQCLASLAGKQLSGEQLSKAIGDLLGARSDGDKSGQDFSATFAAHPCDIQFASGQIRAKFYITRFDSADVEYPAMTVDAEYDVDERAGDLALVRKGSLRVKPLAEDGEKPVTSGRQQTLRLAVQRKLNKAFAQTFLWASPTLPVAGKDTPKLSITKAQVDGGWLQLALERRSAEPVVKTSAAAY